MGRQLREARAVLFEGRHTLVRPARHADHRLGCVAPVAQAAEVTAAVRAAGFPIGVVSGQRGFGERRYAGVGGESLKARVGEFFGPFDTWQFCTHAPHER